jgi:hypothetical protein
MSYTIARVIAKLGAATIALAGAIGVLGMGTAEAAKPEGFTAQLKGPATVTELYSPVNYTLTDTSGTSEGEVKIEVLENHEPVGQIWHDNIKAKAKHDHKFTMEFLPLATQASGKPKEANVLIEAWNRQGKRIFKQQDELAYSAAPAADEPPTQPVQLIDDIFEADYEINDAGAYNIDPLQAHMDYNGLSVNGDCGTDTTSNRPDTQGIVVTPETTYRTPCAWTGIAPNNEDWWPAYPTDFLQTPVEHYGAQALDSAEPYLEEQGTDLTQVGPAYSIDASLTEGDVYFLQTSDETEVAAGGSPSEVYDLKLVNGQIPELSLVSALSVTPAS